ncbi:MAG: GDP-mannose 4,6-dehydratase [Synergistaceae bacterium]|nr:GDP-mannose 4,6-dehydratase [Synergistaceae bacterium]
MSGTVLVTGGAGFIGSHLTQALLSSDKRVIVVDNFNDFYSPSIKRQNIKAVLNAVSEKQAENFVLLEEDIRTLRLDQLKEHESIDTVVHLAAMAGVRPSLINPVLYQDVNVVGTQALLELSRVLKVKKFIFASSSSVYGVNPNVPWSESEDVLEPISPYAASKVSGELQGRVYHHLYGMDFIALRFFTVYGPKQRPDLAIAKFIERAFKREAIDMYGDGTSARDYTFVDDIVNGVLAAVEKELHGYQVINIGNSFPVELRALVKMVEEATGVSLHIQRKPQQPGDVPRTFADISKARQLLGYNPMTSMEEGIRLQVEWFLKGQGC